MELSTQRERGRGREIICMIDQLPNTKVDVLQVDTYNSGCFEMPDDDPHCYN